jgi:hypothetical protein
VLRKVIGLQEQFPTYTQTLPTHQRLPGQLIEAAEEEQLHATACFLAGIDPRRDDACLVQNQQIPRLQIITNIAKDPVLYFARLTMQDQEARGIARLDRSLRDGGFGQGVVEVGGSHEV